MTTDELWPRDAAHRYRVYSQRDGMLDVLSAAPTPQSAGLALVTLHEEDAFPTSGTRGLMDVRPGEETGEWIINPFGGSGP